MSVRVRAPTSSSTRCRSDNYDRHRIKCDVGLSKRTDIFYYECRSDPPDRHLRNWMSVRQVEPTSQLRDVGLIGQHRHRYQKMSVRKCRTDITSKPDVGPIHKTDITIKRCRSSTSDRHPLRVNVGLDGWTDIDLDEMSVRGVGPTFARLHWTLRPAGGPNLLKREGSLELA